MKDEELKVGDKIRFNTKGLEGCFNCAIGLSFMKQKVYTVTNIIHNLPCSDRQYLQVIEVDDPELNYLSLLSIYFDKVEETK